MVYNLEKFETKLTKNPFYFKIFKEVRKWLEIKLVSSKQRTEYEKEMKRRF